MPTDARQRFRDELGELVRSAGLRDQVHWDRAALASDQGPRVRVVRNTVDGWVKGPHLPRTWDDLRGAVLAAGAEMARKKGHRLTKEEQERLEANWKELYNRAREERDGRTLAAAGRVHRRHQEFSTQQTPVSDLLHLDGAATSPQQPELKPTGAIQDSRPTGPQQPGSGLRVWNIPARNPMFTGRDQSLMAIRERLLSGDKAVVQALHGMGGIGKTQLAIEYVHRFAEDYDIAWWVNSEHSELIGDQFAALGSALRCTEPGTETEVVRAVVLAELRERDRWLMVFDNAENPADIARWLPGRGGHVLITSRERNWAEVAALVEVDVLARAESVAFLEARVTGLTRAEANRLAAELGDLPLAMAQAEGFMAETGMPADQYLNLLRTRAGQLLAQGAPGFYPSTLAVVTGLIADRLAVQDPAAADLAILCAFLAPEPIPEELFTGAIGELPRELAVVASDPLAWRQTLAQLARQSLARIDHRGVQMHRLTQAILRDRLTPGQAAASLVQTAAYDQIDDDRAPEWAKRALDLVAAILPPAPEAYQSWPMYAKLAPHIEAITERISRPPVLAQKISALKSLGIYLSASGQLRAAQTTFERVLAVSQAANGPWHPEVAKAFGNLGAVQMRRGELREARSNIEHARAIFEASYGPDHPEVAKAFGNLGTVQMWLGELRRARLSIEHALAIFEASYDPHHSEVAKTFANLGIVQMRLGELREARSNIEHALAISEAVYGRDHPEVAKVLINLGAVQLRLGEVEAARAGLERALAISEAVYGPGHPEVASALVGLGAVQLRLGEVEAARVGLERALAISEAVYGPDHAELVPVLINLGAVQLQHGEVEAARAGLERALAISEAVYGPDHPEVASALINLGAVQLRLGELEAARAGLERALAISEAVYGPGHPEVASALIYLGAVQLRLGELEAARAGLERALAISEAVYGPGHPEVAKVLINLGAVQLRLGEVETARVGLERALAISEAVYGPDHAELVPVLINLGAVQLELGEQAARAGLERALAISEAVYGPGHPEVASALINLGVVQVELGELEAARVGLERALAISEAVYGPDHPEVASALIYLGVIQLGLGELHAARVGLERALAISKAVYGPDHPEVAKVLINLGAVQLELGEQDADASIERALAISEAVYGPDHRKAIKTLIDLAVPRHEETARCLISISLVLMSASTRRNPESQQGDPDS